MMVKLGWLLVSAGLIMMAVVPGARGEVQASYLDRFHNVSYSGSDGSLDWSGPWVEVWENDGPDSGAVRVATDPGCVAGRCLIIASDLLAVNRAGAGRLADASVFADAELSFHVGSTLLGGGGLIGGLSGATLLVEVTTNSGASWSTVDSLLLTDLSGAGATRAISISAYLSAGFGVRFSVRDLLGGRVMIDDVKIAGVLKPSPPPTTTSPTTTTPSATPSTTQRQTTTTSDPTTSTSTPVPSTTRSRESPTTPPDAPERPPDSEPRPPDATGTPSDDLGSGPPDAADPTESPGGRGLRLGGGGVMADYERGRVTLIPIDLPVDYRSSAETIASRSIGLAGLALVVTGASILGVDRRRRYGLNAPERPDITAGTEVEGGPR
jgi:hypothetical protein